MTQFQRRIKDLFFFPLLEANEQIALLCSVERVTSEIYRVVFIKDLFGSILMGAGGVRKSDLLPKVQPSLCSFKWNKNTVWNQGLLELFHI